MKRILTSCAVAALVTTSAFASQARQQVLGTLDPLGVVSAGTHGSLSVEDNMNIFYNPAYVNEYKNWAAMEHSTNALSEGGFVSAFGPVNVGLWLNRSDATNNFMSKWTAGTNYGTNQQPTRPFDLMVGGDMGWKWGLGFTYGQNTNSVSDKEGTTEYSIHAGVSVMDFEPFITYTMGKDKNPGSGTSTDEIKSSALTFGLRYKYGEWAPFAVYRMDGAELSGDSTAAVNIAQRKANAFGLGFARTMRVSDMASLHYGAAYWTKSAHAAASTSDVRVTNKRLPIEVGVEADATSWLVLRAGLNYNLVATDSDLTVVSGAASPTTARIGASFKFGKATMDWAYGSSNGGGIDTTSMGFDNQTFTTASLTYAW